MIFRSHVFFSFHAPIGLLPYDEPVATDPVGGTHDVPGTLWDPILVFSSWNVVVVVVAAGQSVRDRHRVPPPSRTSPRAHVFRKSFRKRQTPVRVVRSIVFRRFFYLGEPRRRVKELSLISDPELDPNNRQNLPDSRVL